MRLPVSITATRIAFCSWTFSCSRFGSAKRCSRVVCCRGGNHRIESWRDATEFAMGVTFSGSSGTLGKRVTGRIGSTAVHPGGTGLPRWLMMLQPMAVQDDETILVGGDKDVAQECFLGACSAAAVLCDGAWGLGADAVGSTVGRIVSASRASAVRARIAVLVVGRGDWPSRDAGGFLGVGGLPSFAGSTRRQRRSALSKVARSRVARSRRSWCATRSARPAAC